MRVLIIMPSWVGDCVMATPALRQVRSAMPGAFLGALVRPGLDELLAGTSLVDEFHVDRARGIMGPKRVAAGLRARKYDAALLLTNSFSTALIARLAFIPVRIGYDRDARGMLLTHRLSPPRRERPHRGFKPVPACAYYSAAASVLLDVVAPARAPSNPVVAYELGLTEEQRAAGKSALHAARLGEAAPLVILNPGANSPTKRWPADRFANIGIHCLKAGASVLVNGSPAEADLCASIVERMRKSPVGAGEGRILLGPAMGLTIGSLKAVIARTCLMVTNDTGPRHIAAAFGVPRIALFGPTDHRWTTPPGQGTDSNEVTIIADPTLPPEEVADDHPERCAIDKIAEATVMGAVDDFLRRRLLVG